MATFLERIECWRDTAQQAGAMEPPPPSVKHAYHPLVESVAPPALGEAPSGPQGRVSVVSVVDEDALDAGLRFLALGHAPVVLNLADDVFPGGCVDVGSGAQEESLFRRTNLCRTLRTDTSPRLYPIADGEAVYSPGVSVFKAREADGWAPLPRPHPRIAFIACPGVKYPRLEWPEHGTRDDARLSPHDAHRLRAKVCAVLETALRHGHDVVILGASGCGAWKCPAPHVAQVFREVLPAYSGDFAHIVFAVLRGADDMYVLRQRLGVACRDNHDIFAQELAPVSL